MEVIVGILFIFGVVYSILGVALIAIPYIVYEVLAKVATQRAFRQAVADGDRPALEAIMVLEKTAITKGAAKPKKLVEEALRSSPRNDDYFRFLLECAVSVTV